MMCDECMAWADSGAPHTKDNCEFKGCTCQHKPPGAWSGKEKTFASHTVTLSVPMNGASVSSATTVPLMTVSQARRLIRESSPTQCSVCMRRVATTPKSKRIVRHKREHLVEETLWDRKTKQETIRRVIRNYVCPGSGKAPLVKGTAVTATSSSARTGDA